ncbi:MAG: rhomboid family intramembrane serine protease [Erysipelotrichaceae bacterium]|nr:rhomboid family intramembrane serine protease [Erysipelotrichaceae bacterium]MBR5755300.1 rhomboid family intramembrane serine protease [Erysipelotrichaceae bacterium]
MKRKRFSIYFNAPITLGFVAICVIAYGLSYLTADLSTVMVFSTYGSSLLNPMTYVRLICHVFGHNSFNHLASNMMYILLLGPMLEEKYHDRLITVIVTTALVTGIVHNIIQPDIMLLGASGVVFAFILLASITGKENGIPITLILAAAIWIGQEIYNGMTEADNISQITHIIGGLSGTVLGLIYKKN